MPNSFPESTSNDAYGNYFQTNYEKTHLPQLPRAMKNRFNDRMRQRLNTSSEEYGRFWSNQHPPVVVRPTRRPTGPDNPPAGLTTSDLRRDKPFKKLLNKYQSESNSFWNSNVAQQTKYDDDDPSNGADPDYGEMPTANYDHRWTQERKNFDGDLKPKARKQWQVPDSERPLPPILRNPASEPREATTDLDKYIERYKLSVGIDRQAVGGQISLPDIKYIDLQLHLHNNSTVTIKAVPFALE